MKDFLSNLGLAVAATLVPIHAMLATVGVLIVADMITGIIAAKKQKLPITSSKMRNTVSKGFIYSVVIICAHYMETHIMGSVLPVTNIVATLISSVEMVSLLENGNIILGNNIFSALIKRLGSKNEEMGKMIPPVSPPKGITKKRKKKKGVK